MGLVNGPASHLLVRPFVVFAARALGPGPTRLRLVKLAHNLDHRPRFVAPHGTYGEDEQRPASQPSTKAA